MAHYYVISYDLRDKNKEEKCDENFNNTQFQDIFIKILCELNATSIEWVNKTTITFRSISEIIEDVKNAIELQEICIDYFISEIQIRDNKLVYRKKITRNNLVKNFRDRVEKNCENEMKLIFTKHIT